LAAGSGSAPYVWTIAAGSTLPVGLTLSSTGVISGTPTIAGTVSASITVTDALSATGTKALSITINAAGTPLTITTATLPGATYGSTYSQALAATGGTTPYTWVLASGALPAGLSLNATTGVISGTVTAPTVQTAPISSFTVRVSDAAPATATAPLAITASLTASASSGKLVYDASCTNCHKLGIYDAVGSPDLGSATLAVITGKFGGGKNHNGQTMTAAQITGFFDFANLY